MPISFAKKSILFSCFEENATMGIVRHCYIVSYDDMAYKAIFQFELRWPNEEGPVKNNVKIRSVDLVHDTVLTQSMVATKRTGP